LIRPFSSSAFVGAMLLTGCASQQNAALQKDVAALHKELAAERQAQEDLRVRLERLESITTQPSAAPAPVVRASQAAPLEAMPVLPVVRVEPPARDRTGPDAPDVDTKVPVRDRGEPRARIIDQHVSVSEAPVDLNALIRKEAAQGDSLKEAAPTPSDKEGDAAFQKATAKYNAGHYNEAAAAFRSFADRYPTHPSASDALYLAGMSEVAANRCPAAKPLFETVLEQYPATSAERRALLALGQCEADVGHDERARSIFNRVVSEHPKTPEAVQAQASLAQLGPGHSP
jgi:tol-pal system protein YbgF